MLETLSQKMPSIRFDVDKFPDAVLGKLPPVTRSLDAAEKEDADRI